MFLAYVVGSKKKVKIFAKQVEKALATADTCVPKYAIGEKTKGLMSAGMIGNYEGKNELRSRSSRFRTHPFHVRFLTHDSNSFECQNHSIPLLKYPRTFAWVIVYTPSKVLGT